VRVNAVAPTYIKTDMTKSGQEKPEILGMMVEGTPQNRIGEPHEVASTVLFLGSEAASLMTGSILVVDGGFTCW
jgi:NAD(P)-dependent dehydrogenase (short-subunit alcohol dehydrogenase family)